MERLRPSKELLGNLVDRWLLLAFLVVSLSYGALSSALLQHSDLYYFSRYMAGGACFLGGLLSGVGYLSLYPPGSRVQAFLAVNVIKATLFGVFGLTFLILALFSAPSTPYSWQILIFYGANSAAGMMKLCLGLYVIFGASRGWLDRMIYKWPWSSGA